MTNQSKTGQQSDQQQGKGGIQKDAENIEQQGKDILKEGSDLKNRAEEDLSKSGHTGDDEPTAA